MRNRNKILFILDIFIAFYFSMDCNLSDLEISGEELNRSASFYSKCRWKFDANASHGSLKDEITVINAPFYVS